MGAVGTIDSISPIDRLTARLVKWSVPRGSDLAEPSDATATKSNHEVSHVSVNNCYIQFIVDHESREVTAKIIDRASGEVVRTIPPEELARCVQESKMAPGTYLEALL